MFPLRLDFGTHGASASIRCVIGRDFGVYSARFDGLRFDNQLVPRVSPHARRWHTIAFTMEGATQLNGDLASTRHVLVAPLESLSLADADSRIEAAPGDFVGIRVGSEGVATSFVDAPALVPIALATANALRALVPAVREGDVSKAFARLRTLLAALVDDEVLTTTTVVEDAPSDPSLVDRVASSVFPLLSQLGERPMLADIVDRMGVGERQILRNFSRLQSDFDLLDRGWRSSVVRWRTTAAVLLLSSAQLSIAEVARLAGYSGPTALGRALREAGLPNASAIRASLLHRDS